MSSINTKIYYFSGTGNSMFIAKELIKLIPNTELISVVKAIQENNFTIESENVGFVFPCHGTTIPIPIKIFVEKMSITFSKYFFGIVTRAGSVFSGFNIIDKPLKKQNKKLNASFIIDMGFNDPKLKEFEVPSETDLKKLEESALIKLKTIKDVISSQADYIEKDTTDVTFSKSKTLNALLEKLIPFMTHYVSPGVKKYFYTDSNCVGCGICEKVCLSRKIKMVNDKPVWQKNITCYLCYACLNYCPKSAVQIYSKIWMKSYTNEKGRYPHPYATYNEIADQKNE